MSDEFRRLLDEAPGAELRSVLESGLRDQPSPRTITRAARKLGIGAAGLGSARAAAAAASRALRASSWTVLAKWGGAGVLLGGIALSPLVLNTPAASRAKVTQRSAPRVSAAVPNSNLLETGPTQEAGTAAVSTSRPTPAVKTAVWPASAAAASAPSAPKPVSSATFPSPVRGAQALAPASIVPNAPGTATSADLLDSEVALLDSTRTALKQGDSTAALALLDRHARLSARSLGAEATLLRVQALVLAGRSAEARAVAQAVLGGKSGLPYAARLRKLAGLVE
ncbi:MAG TPA: hypothetical protein VIK01_05140 [Polyangiaceae bacterium]